MGELKVRWTTQAADDLEVVLRVHREGQALGGSQDYPQSP
jgi:hypothetical protein